MTFLVLGSGIADPQDLWWGPMSVGLAATYAIVVVGGVLVTRRLDLLRVSVAFWSVFAALMGVLAISGHAMTARWNLGPVAGMQFWTTLALSPEVLIFVFFMITDPRTGVTGRAGGVLYGAAVALTSGVLIAFQSTDARPRSRCSPAWSSSAPCVPSSSTWRRPTRLSVCSGGPGSGGAAPCRWLRSGSSPSA